jgi:hypothetical protein
MNHTDRAKLTTLLTAAGFDVTVIPFNELSQAKFNAWLDVCRECFRERNVS